MDIQVTNGELGEYYDQSEGAMRALKKSNPKKYSALLNAYVEAMEEGRVSSDPFVITTLMYKGGVGKSNLARIMNASLSKHGSTLLNVDVSRDAKKYTGHDVINLVEVYNDEPDVKVGEYIRALKDASEYVIIDTPGEVGSPETLAALPETDLFIMPFGTDAEEEDTLITTLRNTLLSDEGYYPSDKSINILFVLNNYQESDDLLDAKQVLGKVMEEIDNRENQDIEVNISFSHLKYSKAIKTMNRSKKSIAQLSTENFAAYRIAKERSFYFMNDVKKVIDNIKEDRNGQRQ